MSETYDLEYGTATIETSTGVIDGRSVFLVDDVLATGGTLVAASRAASSTAAARWSASVCCWSWASSTAGPSCVAEIGDDLPLSALLAV